MASTYSTSLGIEKMGTGDQSGTWGTTTNFNWDIIDRISAYTSVAITTDADTATLTVREASPENLQDGMYRVIKFTGALDSTCTVTIAPNTAKMFFIIINATTDSGSGGPYSLILSQGSGANVTVGNGKASVIYCDGAGGGAAVIDAFSDLQITDDLSLASDSAVIKMGADDDITVTHVADVGLKLKQAGATGDGSPFVLTLQTGELDIAAADVLGQIDFQAPDEATGTDAQLVAAGIAAVSEGDFSSTSNATKLSFKTASSAAAAETMSLSSAGLLTVADDIVFKDGGTIGVTSATDALTLSSAGLLTIKDDLVLADGKTIGNATTADLIHLAAAETVFNEGSADIDFRVESDDNDSMLKVNAAANSVGIGCDSSNTEFLKVGTGSGADGTQYDLLKFQGSGSGPIACVCKNDVGTSATTIATVTIGGVSGLLAVVTGGTDPHTFTDLVLFHTSGGTPATISSVVKNSPPSRTYSASGNSLQLAYASGSHATTAWFVTMRSN